MRDKYAVLSDGGCHENPRFLRQTEKKLKRAQQKLFRLKRESANYMKQVSKIQKLHEKIFNQRRDFLHKLSFNLAKEYSVIAVEDLNIRQLVKTNDYPNLFLMPVGECFSVCFPINVKGMAEYSSKSIQNSPHRIVQNVGNV